MATIPEGPQVPSPRLAPPGMDFSPSDDDRAAPAPSVEPRARSRTRNPPSASREPSRRPPDSRRLRESFDHEPHWRPSMGSTRPLRRHDDWDDSEHDGHRNDRYWLDDLRFEDWYYQRDRPRRTQSARSRPPRAYLNHRHPDSSPEGNESDEVPYRPERPRFAPPPLPPVQLADEEGAAVPSAKAQHTGRGGTGLTRLEWADLSPDERAEAMRIPLTAWMNSSVKNHFVASLGEFIGTTLFLLFAFAGTEVANIQSRANGSNNQADSGTTTGGATGFNVSVLLYISLIFGFSLMVNVWIFFRISGGLFNPAVTLAMVLVRAIQPSRAACLFVAQMCGSLLASVIVVYLFPENFNVRTTLGGGATIAQGVLIEAILTAELVFTIFMLAKEKHRATFMAPVGIGLALFIAEMVGVQFTGGSLNPARSFGPCAVTATFDQEHWIYWVGPLAGSLIAVAFYRFIKTLEYEMANPGADGDPENDPTRNPEKKAEIRASRQVSQSGL